MDWEGFGDYYLISWFSAKKKQENLCDLGVFAVRLFEPRRREEREGVDGCGYAAIGYYGRLPRDLMIPDT